MSTDLCVVDVEDWLGAGYCTVGDVGDGVLADLIPSTGTSGPAIAYPSLEFPADSGKGVIARWVSIPAGLYIAANEDTTATVTADAPGIYRPTFQLYLSMVPQGEPKTAEFIFGALTGTVAWDDAQGSYSITGGAGAVPETNSGTVAWDETSESWIVGGSATGVVAAHLGWDERQESWLIQGTVGRRLAYPLAGRKQAYPLAGRRQM